MTEASCGMARGPCFALRVVGRRLRGPTVLCAVARLGLNACGAALHAADVEAAVAVSNRAAPPRRRARAYCAQGLGILGLASRCMY